jgi:hypothetical protein
MILFMTLCTVIASAQEIVGKDSVMILEKNAQAKAAHATKDSLERIFALEDSIELANAEKKAKQKRDWSTWRPNAKRALWLALAIPGAGQIYNRKYWKLPIVYGGFVGCIYAISWNNQMYHDYAQAYIDLKDDDPNTQSYNQFLHLGVTITDSNAANYEELFRKRKDRYRRWRDLSVFALVAVYALSVIDAYVDASLSEFDISKDLSLRIAPTVLSDESSFSSRNPLKSSAVGVGCSLKF